MVFFFFFFFLCLFGLRLFFVKDLKATDNSTETEQDDSILHLASTTHHVGTEVHNHIVEWEFMDFQRL